MTKTHTETNTQKITKHAEHQDATDIQNKPIFVSFRIFYFYILLVISMWITILLCNRIYCHLNNKKLGRLISPIYSDFLHKSCDNSLETLNCQVGKYCFGHEIVTPQLQLGFFTLTCIAAILAYPSSAIGITRHAECLVWSCVGIPCCQHVTQNVYYKCYCVTLTFVVKS